MLAARVEQKNGIRMLESGSSGSVRGVLSNEHPYREPGSKPVLTAPKRHFRSTPLNGHRETGPVGPVGANKQHRGCKPHRRVQKNAARSYFYTDQHR